MLSLDIIETVARSPKLSGWEGLGMAVQAYSKRARAVCGWANALGRETGKRMSIRLVKGAYWDSEIKYTQERGLSDKDRKRVGKGKSGSVHVDLGGGRII